MSDIQRTDVIIIGAGPVGLFSAFSCGMLGMKSHVIDALDSVGGQCTALYPEKPIYDIPAFPQINAEDLIKNLEKQAEKYSPTYHLGQQVTGLEKVEEFWRATTSKGAIIEAKVVMIAAGCGAFGPNRPPIEGLDEYEECGSVAYMVQKKNLYQGKDIVIAGGGDSAVDWALSLVDVAKSVKLVHRRPKFRCAPDSTVQLNKLVEDGRIELIVPYQLAGLDGENGKLNNVIVKDLQGNERKLKADNLLPFYGLAMELGPIADWGLDINNKRIAINVESFETNQEGIYAIGDINEYAGKLKLITCGFSEAAMAAHHAYPQVCGKALHFEYSTSKG